MRQTSRAKRLAVKAITGAKAALLRARQLERGIITRIIELAQAYGHHDAAPYSTDQQVILDEMYAAAWNRYVEKHCPDEPRRAIVFGPRDAGGTQFVPKDKSRHGQVVRDNRMSSVPLEAIKDHGIVLHLDQPANGGGSGKSLPRPTAIYEVRDLTDAEFRKLTMIYEYAEAARVDPATFRAEANLAWESLRHRKVGMKVKGDLIERDRLDDLADNQATESQRQMKRLRRLLDRQVRDDASGNGDPMVLPAPFRSDPASD